MRRLLWERSGLEQPRGMMLMEERERKERRKERKERGKRRNE